MQNEQQKYNKFGKFISFEGIDGSGKTTQLEHLAKTLLIKNYRILVTREPGGTEEGEIVRKLLLNKEDKYNWDKISQLLLLMISRREHYLKVLLPKIKEGYVVLCDRFIDSTIAYQCAGSGIPHDIYNKITKIVINKFTPDITILLDLPVKEAMTRIKKRTFNNNFDKHDYKYYSRVRKEYLKISSTNKRVIKENALNSEFFIKNKIYNIVTSHIINK